MIGGDLNHLHNRSGLVGLCNRLFRAPTLKTVVQVRREPEDSSSTEDRSNIRGVGISLRTVEFEDIANIDDKLEELGKEGRPIWVIFEFK